MGWTGAGPLGVDGGRAPRGAIGRVSAVIGRRSEELGMKGSCLVRQSSIRTADLSAKDTRHWRGPNGGSLVIQHLLFACHDELSTTTYSGPSLLDPGWVAKRLSGEIGGTIGRIHDLPTSEAFLARPVPLTTMRRRAASSQFA